MGAQRYWDIDMVNSLPGVAANLDKLKGTPTSMLGALKDLGGCDGKNAEERKELRERWLGVIAETHGLKEGRTEEEARHAPCRCRLRRERQPARCT